MGEYRHQTDRIDGTAIADCPECDLAWTLEVGSSELPLDELVVEEMRECPVCNVAMDCVLSERPTELIR